MQLVPNFAQFTWTLSCAAFLDGNGLLLFFTQFFFTGLSVFFILTFRNSLHILDASPFFFTYKYIFPAYQPCIKTSR